MPQITTMQAFGTPRKPTPQELDELFGFEWDNRYDMDCFGEEAELAGEIRERIGAAHIAVFAPASLDGQKVMLVLWELPSRYALFTWEGGQLKITAQDSVWFDELYSTHTSE
jgi:hypothetical protein